MPNITTTVYLSDEDYNEKFLPRKQEILNDMRNHIREKLGIRKR